MEKEIISILSDEDFSSFEELVKYYKTLDDSNEEELNEVKSEMYCFTDKKNLIDEILNEVWGDLKEFLEKKLLKL